jgi:hypothetical protein
LLRIWPRIGDDLWNYVKGQIIETAFLSSAEKSGAAVVPIDLLPLSLEPATKLAAAHLHNEDEDMTCSVRFLTRKVILTAER